MIRPGAAAVLVAVALCAGVGEAQVVPELDAVIGTWQLDLARSTFNPGPSPKAGVRIYEPGHEGIKTTIKTQHADGKATTVEFVASYNEVIAAVTGSTTVDAIQMKR